jgi:lysophospholipase L1-like esterase
MKKDLSKKKKIAFLLIVCVLFFGALELGTRICLGLSRRGMRQPAPIASPNGDYELHPYLTYALGDKHAEHTAQGYRGTRLFQPGHQGLRIACLGGSTTYGICVRQHNCYPQRLEEALARDLTEDVEVINAGVAGYSSYNLIGQLAFRIVHLQPDAVVIYAGINDSWNRLYHANFQLDNTHAQQSGVMPRKPLWRKSLFLDWVAERLGGESYYNLHIHRVFWKERSGDPAENWRNSSSLAFRSNLRTLIAICRAHDIVPMLCIQAHDLEHYNKVAEYHPHLWKRALVEHMQVVREVAAETQVELIDLHEPLSGRQELFADFMHMNREGNIRRAEIIADRIKRWRRSSPPSP